MMRAKFLTGIFSLLLFVPFMMYGIQTGSDTKIGTNTLSAKTPQVVYASGEEKFLTVWTGNEAGVEHIFCSVHTEATVSGTPSVTGILLSIPAGGNFRYAQFPQVAYNATTGKAAVVWIENYGAGIDYLKMSILDMRTDPVLAPVPIRIDNSDTPKMAVTVQSDQTGNFLVAWYDGSTLNVTGQLYSGSGTPAGGSFIFGQVPVGYLFPYAIDIACNSTNNSFMVVWSDFVASLSACRVVGSAPVLPPVTISDPDGTLNPAIAYNDSLNNFMVVYNTFSHCVRGRIINDSGLFTTDTYTFGNTTDPATDPDIAFNTDNNNFAVSWSSLPGSGIWIQELFIEDCAHYSVPVKISEAAITANAPSITYGSTDNNYWVTWFGAPQGKDEIWLQRYSSDFRWVEAHCKDITVYLDGNGSYSLQVTDIDDGSRAVCETPSLSASLSTLSCSHIPSASVTLTAKHSKGFESACQSVVTVLDTISPTVVAQDLTVYLDENGLRTVAASEVDNGSSDACGILTRTLSKSLFGCGDVGPNDVILTVADKNGNSKRAGAVITVVDNRPPILVMHDFTIGLDIDGAANLLVYDVIEHAYDPCGIASMVLSQSTFDCDDLGPHTVTLTVTDNNGNISTGSAVVTVVDNRPPDVVTQSVTINLNELGVASITAAEVDNGSTDNCGIASMALSKTDFDCQDVGPNTVTLTVTDVNGNSSSATATVTVVDNILPTVKVRSVTVHVDLDGLARIEPGMIDDRSTDNCGIAFMELDRTTFSCSDVGGQRVTLTVTDVNGNRNSAQAGVFVRDDTGPLITLGKSQFVIDLNEEGLAYMSPGMTNYTVEDGCGPVTVELSQTIFSCEDVGYNQIAFAAYDMFGNASSVDIGVLVRESVPPIIFCPGDITVTRNPNCQYRLPDYTIVGDYQAADNCGSYNLIITQSPLPGTLVPIGITPITLTATDAGRNSSSCTFNLIVEGPAVDFTADQTSVCHETAIAFTGESVEAVSWAWNFGDGNSSTEQNPVHTYALPGSYSVSLTITAADGCTNSEVKTDFITVHQPVAGFAASPLTGTAIPHTVFFTDQSTGADGWAWDFGDGGVSTAQNPIYSYTQYGNYTVILTATNSTTGCSDTASVKIEIGDEIPPEISCPDDAIVYTGTECSGVLPDFTSFVPVTDNLDPAPVVTQSPLPGTIIAAGTEVTLTAIDYSDNQSSCSFEVSLVDNQPPVVLTRNIVVPLDVSGEATIAATEVDNGSSDNCGIASMALSQIAFDCSHVGANTITLTVTDVNGNSNAATAVVTVEDHVLPEVLIKNIDVPLDASGQATFAATDVDNGSSDACGIATMVLSQTVFDCSDLGSNMVTLTVTDNNGNINTGMVIITVVDNLPPTVVTQPVTVYLNEQGYAEITARDVDNGSTDNCGVASLELLRTYFDCQDVGSNAVTLTVTDINGNSNTAPATVTVVDTQPPIVKTRTVTVDLDANGVASIDTDMVDNGSTDNCGIATRQLSKSTFSCSDVGGVRVTLTVTDVNGNSNSAVADVIVRDKVAPAITLINTEFILNLNEDGFVNLSPEMFVATAWDACGTVDLRLSQTIFYCSDVGPRQVMIGASDIHGNYTEAYFYVHVRDNFSPSITCPGDITVSRDANCQYRLPDYVDQGAYSVTDNCGLQNLVISQFPYPGTFVPTGTTPITLTVLDASANHGSCTFNLIVEGPAVDFTADQTSVCHEMAIAFTGESVEAVSWAWDFGDGNSSTEQNPVHTYALPGSYSVSLTITAADGCTNSEVKTDFITVHQPVAGFTASPLTGTAIPHTVFFTDQSTGADGWAWDFGDGGVSTAQNPIHSYTQYGNYTVILTATNNTTGCSDTASVKIEIGDEIPPEISCPGDAIVYTGTECSGVLPDYTALAVVTDNLDPAPVVTQSPLPGTIITADTEVTLTAIDYFDNQNFCSFAVSLVDNTPPVVVTEDITIWLNSNGVKTITPAWVDNGSADNCGISTMMLSQTDFDCSDVGMKEITLTVTDVNGNSHTENATVTVVDHLSPIAVAKDVALPLDGNGRATLTAAEVDNYSWDACGIASMTLSQTEFDCSHVGVNTVTLTVTDVHGNTDTDTAVITVEDNTPPLVKTQNITLELDAAGTATAAAGQVDSGSTDHCGIATMVLSQTAFDCSHVGANTVTLTVIDVNGNRSSATAVVTVVDNQPPVVVTQAVILELDAAGTTSLTVNQVDNGSVDNCGIASMTLSQTAFDCRHVGENMVTLTVTDIHGDENSAPAIVTVVDSSIPVVLTKDITVQLDASGNAVVVADAVDNGSTDICGIVSMELSQTLFDCNHVGENTVILSVTDMGGNSNSATAVVTIEDHAAPEVMTKNIIVALDVDGQATIAAADVDNGSFDACGIASMLLSQTVFDCSHVGTNTVTLTVTDMNGNSNSATAMVTVEDRLAPVVEIQPLTVWLDADGQVEVTPEAVIAEASDNCGIVRYELSQSIFDCTHLGPNEVTLWAIDGSGNRTEMATTVLVEDSLAPVVAPQSLTIWLDSQGSYDLTYEEILPMLNDVTDNCTPADDLQLEIILMNSRALITRFGDMVSGTNPYLRSFSCAQAGLDIPIRFTFTDGSGNRAVSESLITVLDTISPVVQVRELTRIDLDAQGRVTLDPMDVITEVWDACGIASMTLDRTQFICDDQGVQLVQLTVTDHHGNRTIREARVVTADVIEPVVITRPVTLYLDAQGEATLTPEQVDNGSYDNCSVKVMSVSQTLFTKADLGTKPIVFCVSDLRGNSPCGLAEVTVVDALPPVLTCKPVELLLDAHGQASLQAGDLVASVSDNVAVATVVASQTQFGCAALGENRVVVTATDSSGNSTHCEAVVTVRDPLPPVIQPVTDMVVQVDQLVSETTVSYPVIVVTDNCSYTLTQVSGRGPAAKFPVGTTTERWRATDASGNSVTISFTITVEVVYRNHPPIVQNAVPDVVMEVTELLALPVTDASGEVFADPDGDLLTIAALLQNGDPLPAWIRFTADSVILQPMHADTGCVQMVLTATDPSGLAVTDHFTICVKGWPVSAGDIALEPFGVELFPNPTTGRVQVEIQMGYGTTGALQMGVSDPNKTAFGISGNTTQGVLMAPAAGTEDISLRVFDAGGRLVLTKVYLRDETITFDLSGHISGIYYVRIAVDGKEVVRKVQLETKR